MAFGDPEHPRQEGLVGTGKSSESGLKTQIITCRR